MNRGTGGEVVGNKQMARLSVAILSILGFLLTARVYADPLAGIDEYIKHAMADWQTPGLAIAVVQNDSVILSKGYGVREQGKTAPVDEKTVFALSSNGKAFTSTAAGIMVDEGKLSWDSTVAERLPDFQLYDPWVTRHVTIRDLLGHRVSGDMGAAEPELWAFLSVSRNELLKRLRYLEPGNIRFRDRFSYRNTSILAAGQAAAAAAGMSWDDLVMSRILRPLEMTSATTSVLQLWDAKDVAGCYMCDLDHTPGHEQAKVSNIVMPHISTDTGPKPIPWRLVDNVGPAGSINANVMDVSSFVRMQLGKGTFKGKRIVSEAALGETHTPQMLLPTAPLPAGPGFGHFWSYGFGWFIGEYHGHKLLIHTGLITGFSSAIALLPEEHIGVAVLSNQHTGSIVRNLLPPALSFVIFDRLLKLPHRDWSTDWRAAGVKESDAVRAYEQQLTSQRVEGTAPSMPLQKLVGRFANPAFGDLAIRLDNGRPTVTLNDSISARVEHWHYEVYRLTWNSPTPISYFLTYSADTHGQIDRVTIDGWGDFQRHEGH
jgi:CubicO group peptidase (beta-lactamase class C family)